MYIAFDRDGELLGLFQNKIDAVQSFNQSFRSEGEIVWEEGDSIYLQPEDEEDNDSDRRYIGSIRWVRVNNEPIYFSRNKRRILNGSEFWVSRI